MFGILGHYIFFTLTKACSPNSPIVQMGHSPEVGGGCVRGAATAALAKICTIGAL